MIAESTAAVAGATLRQGVVTEGTATIAGMGNTEATATHGPTGVRHQARHPNPRIAQRDHIYDKRLYKSRKPTEIMSWRLRNVPHRRPLRSMPIAFSSAHALATTVGISLPSVGPDSRRVLDNRESAKDRNRPQHKV